MSPLLESETSSFKSSGNWSIYLGSFDLVLLHRNAEVGTSSFKQLYVWPNVDLCGRRTARHNKFLEKSTGWMNLKGVVFAEFIPFCWSSANKIWILDFFEPQLVEKIPTILWHEPCFDDFSVDRYEAIEWPVAKDSHQEIADLLHLSRQPASGEYPSLWRWTAYDQGRVYIAGGSEMLWNFMNGCLFFKVFIDLWRLANSFLKREFMIVNKDIYRVSRVVFQIQPYFQTKLQHVRVDFGGCLQGLLGVDFKCCLFWGHLTPMLVDDSEFDHYFLRLKSPPI